RAPREAKVRVYNPDEAQDGYASPHTVVEIVCDDMPFLVDSVTMELNRQGYAIDLVIHPMMRFRRDQQGRLIEVVEAEADPSEATEESILRAEVTHEDDASARRRLKESVTKVLDDVAAAVHDWREMRHRTAEI